jgi:hypothetical protein
MIRAPAAAVLPVQKPGTKGTPVDDNSGRGANCLDGNHGTCASG